MTWFRTVLRELVGLFVDDGSFALAIFVWVALLWLFLRYLHFTLPNGLFLFAGLAAILLESVLRYSRKRRS